MKKAVSWKLSEEIIEKIDKLAELKNWKKAAVIEKAIEEFFDKNIMKDAEPEKGRIKIDNKYFNVLTLTSVEIGQCGDMGISVDKIIADEDISYKEFNYKKGQIIYDGDSDEDIYKLLS